MCYDELEVRSILSRLLSTEVNDVTVAANGEIAWMLIQEIKFDKIFLDLKMPGVDGQELFQLITEFTPDLAERVVFITGDTASSDTRKFLDTAARPVLTKPFTIDAVRQLIRPKKVDRTKLANTPPA